MMKYLKDVVTHRVDTRFCAGCGRCAQACPQGVLQLVEGKAVPVARDSCIECRTCCETCPESAITVRAGAALATR